METVRARVTIAGAVRRRRLLLALAAVVALAVAATPTLPGRLAKGTAQAPGAGRGSAPALAAGTPPAAQSPQVDDAADGGAPPSITVLGGLRALPGAVTEQLAACAPGGSRRLAGSERAETAALVARAAYPQGAGEVVVASGSVFADALAAGPLAVRRDAPLLLAYRDQVPAPTLDALRELAPERITLVGGTAALSARVEAALGRLAPVRRIGGEDRFATAAAIATASGGQHAETVWIATGSDWADALAAGPAAARDGAPILLALRDGVPEATREALQRLRPARVLVAGGTAAVSDAAAAEVARPTGADVLRVSGADRYATAAAIARHAFAGDAAGVLLATGEVPADALAAIPFAARTAGPVLLARGPSIPLPTVEALQDLGGIACRSVLLEAGPVERLALGGGVRLAAQGPTGTVTVGTTPGRLLLPAAAQLRLSYPPPPAGASRVTWTQQVGAGDERVVVEQPWRGTRPRAPGGIALAWHATSTWEAYRREVDAAPGLTVSSPVSMHLDAAGRLTGGVDAGFVAHANARGVAVWPAVASLDDATIATALSDEGRRAALANAVSERARAAGAQGVNIDLEGFTHASAGAVTDFARKLSAAVHAWDGVTSVDLTAMTDTWATPPSSVYGHWSTAPQRRELSEAVDYVILMAYDQHNRLRPGGPVAGRRWVEEAVRFQLRYTDPDRLVLGVPLYGRLWEPGRLDRPRTLRIGQVASMARSGRRSGDPGDGADRVDLPDGRFFWLEDHAGLAHRTGLVAELGLAGTASWRLGFDDAAVWPVLAPR